MRKRVDPGNLAHNLIQSLIRRKASNSSRHRRRLSFYCVLNLRRMRLKRANGRLRKLAKARVTVPPQAQVREPRRDRIQDKTHTQTREILKLTGQLHASRSHDPLRGIRSQSTRVANRFVTRARCSRNVNRVTASPKERCAFVRI